MSAILQHQHDTAQRLEAVEAEIAKALLETVGDIRLYRHDLLTALELDVVLRIIRGQALKQIARALNIGVGTVSGHQTRALFKLGLGNEHTNGLARGRILAYAFKIAMGR